MNARNYVSAPRSEPNSDVTLAFLTNLMCVFVRFLYQLRTQYYKILLSQFL
jgi:hypothetical protein